MTNERCSDEGGGALLLGTRAGRTLLTAAAIVVIVAVAVVLLVSRSDSDGPSAASADAGPAQVVRENSHRLNSAPSDAVTFVEFLDFECEACRAAYPVVEQLRAEYGDRVEFVVRTTEVAPLIQVILNTG
jgi:protein-disulfide isomerase